MVYAIADQFLAVSHRILSDIYLAEDATQQALLSVWQDLPQLRDPALRGLVVSAPGARLLCRGPEVPPLGTEPEGCVRIDEPTVVDGLSAIVDRDQLERAFRSLSINHERWWSCTTTWTCRSTGWPTSSARRSGRWRKLELHYATKLRSALKADAQPTTRELAR